MPVDFLYIKYYCNYICIYLSLNWIWKLLQCFRVERGISPSSLYHIMYYQIIYNYTYCMWIKYIYVQPYLQSISKYIKHERGEGARKRERFWLNNYFPVSRNIHFFQINNSICMITKKLDILPFKWLYLYNIRYIGNENNFHCLSTQILYYLKSVNILA